MLWGALLLMCDIKPCTGYLENLDSMSYAGLLNVDTFYFTISKNNIC